jgi:hypothetical protein
MHSSVLLDVFPMALFVRKNGLRSMKSKPKRIEPSFYVHDWAPFINNPSGFCPLACVDTSSVDTSSVSAGPRVDLAAESIRYPHRSHDNKRRIRLMVNSRDGQNDSFPGTSSFSSVHYNDSFIWFVRFDSFVTSDYILKKIKNKKTFFIIFFFKLVVGLDRTVKTAVRRLEMPAI